MFKRLHEWFISLFKKESGLPAKKEEKIKPLKLDLQFFADEDNSDDNDSDDDSGDSDDDSDDIDNDELDIDELLKDKQFKKQYQAKLKEQLNKRMRKYKDIDPEEYRRLKEQAGKKRDKQDKDDEDELETLKSELTEKEKRIERAERREKRAMVKEFAVDNQVNPKLLARLINVDDIELDEDGEPENLDDLFEELEEEFPEYFGATDDDEEEDEPKRKRKSTFVPGARQKSNKKKKVDPYEAGRLKALERHKKEEK